MIMNKRMFLLLLFFPVTFSVFFSCRKDPGEARPMAENKPPIANAGNDTIILLPQDSVTLNGNSSYDPDGTIKEYRWSKVSGPASLLIKNPKSATPLLRGLTPGVYQFELKVTDDGELTGSDTMFITVAPPVVSQNCDNRAVIQARLVQVGSLSIGRNWIFGASAGNKLLFAGGNIESGLSFAYSSRVDIYDLEKKTWSTAELTVPERQGMAVATVANKILFAGGGDNDGNVRTSRVDIYDASNNTWTTAELSQPRIYLAAATLGDKVYFAGGANTSSSAVVDIFDNTTNTWSTASLSQARHGLSATTAGNKIYFAGGATLINSNDVASAVIDVFDGTTNSWTTSSMAEPKNLMASIAVANKIFWAGGGTDLVEIRDLSTGVSSFSCILARSSPAAVVKGDNIIFFTGYGYPPNGTQFEIYNITTNTWSTAMLDRPIFGATIISVNNTVYVTGGCRYAEFPPYNKEVWTLEF